MTLWLEWTRWRRRKPQRQTNERHYGLVRTHYINDDHDDDDEEERMMDVQQVYSYMNGFLNLLYVETVTSGEEAKCCGSLFAHR